MMRYFRTIKVKRVLPALLLIGFMVLQVMAPLSVYADGLSGDELNALETNANWVAAKCDTIAAGETDVNISGEGARAIFGFFVSQGLKPEQAAGIVGNIAVESAHTFDPTIVQGGGHSDTPTGSGYGIVQFTPPSKLTGIISAANIDGKPGELLTQLKAVMAQLDGKAGGYSEKQAGDDIKSAETVENATRAWQGDNKIGGKYFGYERPASESATLASRIAAAKAALKKYGNSTGTGAGSESSDASSTCTCDGSGIDTAGKLDKFLSDLAEKNGGKTAISVSTIDGDIDGSASGDIQLPTRSSYKLYTAYATIRAIEAGKITWSTKVWNGHTVEDTMEQMIVKSNNDAAEALRTNATIGKPAEVTAMLQNDAGLSNKTVMGTGDASDPAGSNSQSTANDFTKLLLLLEKRKLPGVSNDGNYDKLIGFMKRATTDGGSARDGIAAGVGGNIQVADKPGWASGSVDPASNDVGIVYADTPYVISILTDKPAKWSGVADIAKAVQAKISAGSSPSNSDASSGCATNAGAGNGDLLTTVKGYAWPTYHPAVYVNARPAYAAAVLKARKEGRYVGGSRYPGIDCGGFVTTAMIDSGYEPNYNSAGKGGFTGSPGDANTQWGWLEKHWQKIHPTSTKDMQPGDVAINDHHTYIYVGKIDGFNSVIASASLDERAPMAGHETPAATDFSWYRKK